MAFPQLESVTGTAFGASETTAHAANYPATVNSGDLLIILASFFDTPQGGTPVITTPSGYTELDEVLDTGSGAGDRVSGIYIKVAGGSEGGGTEDVATDNTSFGSVMIIRISAWEGTTSGVEISTPNTGSSTSPNPSSLTPSWGSEDTLWVPVEAADDDDAIPTSAPTNYGNLNTQTTGAGNDKSTAVAMATRENATDTEDPGAFTGLANAERWHAWTIGVREASAAADPIPDRVFQIKQAIERSSLF